MALSQQDFDKLKSRLHTQTGIPTDDTFTATETITPMTAKEPSYLDRLGGQYSQAGQNIVEGIKTGADEINKGNLLTGALRSGLRTAGNVAGAAFAPITAAIEPLIKPAIESSMQIPQVKEAFTRVSELAQRNPEIAKDLQNIFDLATVGAGGAIEKPVVGAIKTGVEKTAKATAETLVKGLETARGATSKIIKASQPVELSVEGATKQILQGQTGDLKAGLKALKSIDTTNVKTYEELFNKLNEKIPTLARQVDEDLAVDTTSRPLKNLVIKEKTTSGKTIQVKPVENALNQLKELYGKTGDAVSEANINELIGVAKSKGFTNLEINDIAKTYGQEFKSKAFSKLGDPLTSVNAQMYENTRKSLKELARQGIKGTEAKEADALMSSIYNTKDLISKNVEAVNKLQQRIQERGLFEKIGHGLSKYADILSGGSLRGLVGGLLPRGAGYKVLNSLDIEQALEKNLKIIQKAIASGKEADILKAIKDLEVK